MFEISLSSKQIGPLIENITQTEKKRFAEIKKPKEFNRRLHDSVEF